MWKALYRDDVQGMSWSWWALNLTFKLVPLARHAPSLARICTSIS